MSKRRSWKLGAFSLLYAALVSFGVTASPGARAHPCVAVTTNGTTTGTCEEHGKGSHLCDTTGNGTKVVVCVDTTPP